MISKGKIVFVGPMGAGKTTIGRQVAANLDWEFFDSDRLVEERTGVSIPLIFELEGEEGFRWRETEVLKEISNVPNIVLATGGGAVLKEENREVLKQNSLVIFLHASIDQLFERTAKDKNRPLLQDENPKEKLRSILDQRIDIYKNMADLIVKTDNQSVAYTVKKIIELIKNYN